MQLERTDRAFDPASGRSGRRPPYLHGGGDYAMQMSRDMFESRQSELLQLLWQVGGLAIVQRLDRWDDRGSKPSTGSWGRPVARACSELDRLRPCPAGFRGHCLGRPEVDRRIGKEKQQRNGRQRDDGDRPVGASAAQPLRRAQWADQ